MGAKKETKVAESSPVDECCDTAKEDTSMVKKKKKKASGKDELTADETAAQTVTDDEVTKKKKGKRSMNSSSEGVGDMGDYGDGGVLTSSKKRKQTSDTFECGECADREKQTRTAKGNEEMSIVKKRRSTVHSENDEHSSNDASASFDAVIGEKFSSKKEEKRKSACEMHEVSEAAKHNAGGYGNEPNHSVKKKKKEKDLPSEAQEVSVNIEQVTASEGNEPNHSAKKKKKKEKDLPSEAQEVSVNIEQVTASEGNEPNHSAKKKKKKEKDLSSDAQEVSANIEQASASEVKKKRKERDLPSEAREVFNTKHTSASEDACQRSSNKIKEREVTENYEMEKLVETQVEGALTQNKKKKKKKKKEQNFLPSEGIDELAAENTNEERKRRKKEKAECVASTTNVSTTENDGNTSSREETKKKVFFTSTKSSGTQPLGEYVVGSLSSLFSGGKTPVSEIGSGTHLMQGETAIKPKTKKEEDDPDKKAGTVDQLEIQEDLEDNRKSRVQQRENRKKAHEQRMSLEEKRRTLFVGNMPITMNEKACKKLFSQYGSIESVRMRSVVPPKQTITKRIAHLSRNFHEKQSSVNFYVKFKNEESVKNALAYNGTILERHRIRVDTCTTKAKYDRKFTVFVGNLPLDVQDDALSSFFDENVGEVSFVRCIKDGSTGMGKGFAFVVFKSASSVPLALNMTGLEFQKRELRITKVLKKAKVKKVQETQKKYASAKSKLTNEQKEKMNKFKFSTKRQNGSSRPRFKKKVKKVMNKKNNGKVKSLMQ